MNDEFNLEERIHVSEISIRAFNALTQNGIFTIRDLIELKEVDLKNMRNIGKDGLKTIKMFLERRGLSLKQGTLTSEQIKKNLMKIPAMINIVNEKLIQIENSIKTIKYYLELNEKEKTHEKDLCLIVKSLC